MTLILSHSKEFVIVTIQVPFYKDFVDQFIVLHGFLVTFEIPIQNRQLCYKTSKPKPTRIEDIIQFIAGLYETLLD